MAKNGTLSIVKEKIKDGVSETTRARNMGIAYLYTRDQIMKK